MKITLRPKLAKFSAAHSLPSFGPDHPCAHLHGHTWWVRAFFRGKPVDGVLVPYQAVKETVARLDHAWLDACEDDVERCAELRRMGLVFKPAPAGIGLPTGENILAWLVREFEQVALEHDAELVRVELLEDPIPGDGHELVWERQGDHS